MSTSGAESRSDFPPLPKPPSSNPRSPPALSPRSLAAPLRHADGFQTPRRVAIFRALQLGDMLCAVPALRAVRAALPEAQVILIGLPWAHAFVARYADLIDELLLFPGAVGFPEQTETDAGLPAFYETCRARRFDLAIQLHGSGGPANDITLRLGAPLSAGFTQHGETRNAPGQYFIPWPDNLPEPARYTALMRRLGVRADDLHLSFPLTGADRIACDMLIEQCGLEPRRLVLLHPGAQLPSRRWPAERFAAVADALAGDGWQIAITGTAGETELTGAVLRAMASPAIHLAGRTSLGVLAALLARTQLVVCNDTGISHMAAAMRIPSVVIASGSDTRRWSPLDSALHQVLADHPSCRPCAFARCPVGHPCALNVSVEAVAEAALTKLHAAPSAHRPPPYTLHEPARGAPHESRSQGAPREARPHALPLVPFPAS